MVPRETTNFPQANLCSLARIIKITKTYNRKAPEEQGSSGAGNGFDGFNSSGGLQGIRRAYKQDWLESRLRFQVSLLRHQSLGARDVVLSIPRRNWG